MMYLSVISLFLNGNMKNKFKKNALKRKKVVLSDGDGAPIFHVVSVNGVIYPDFGKVDMNTRLKEINRFKAGEDDVWIVGYPKSGAHWTHDIVKMVLAGNADHVADFKMDSCFECRPFSYLDALDCPRLISTHLTVDKLPNDVFAKRCKIILNIRNPKDVAVSFFHHIKGVLAYRYNGTFSGFLQAFLRDNFIYGSWFDHVTGWINFSKDHPDVLVLHYEDMSKDLSSVVRGIADHLQVTLRPEVCEKIVEQCTFAVMKERKREQEQTRIRFRNKEDSLFRKGKVGDWKTWFSVEENAAFDALYQEKMTNCDLKIQFVR